MGRGGGTGPSAVKQQAPKHTNHTGENEGELHTTKGHHQHRAKKVQEPSQVHWAQETTHAGGETKAKQYKGGS